MFKIGDLVKVKDDVVIISYDNFKEWRGHVGVVTNVEFNSCEGTVYEIDNTILFKSQHLEPLMCSNVTYASSIAPKTWNDSSSIIPNIHDDATGVTPNMWKNIYISNEEASKHTLTFNTRQRGFEIVDEKHRAYSDVEINIPVRGSSSSAGYDIYTPVEIVIPPNGISDVIFTDIKAYMLPDEVLEIYPRSSIGFKKGLMLVNTVGIIDSDYYSNKSNDGNIGFKLKNLTDKEVRIEAGERVLQGIFKKYLIVDDDNCNKERVGGIGSTN